MSGIIRTLHDRELQRQRSAVKIYNSTSSLVRSEDKNIFSYSEKRTNRHNAGVVVVNS
jgi:hypothetical protein